MSSFTEEFDIKDKQLYELVCAANAPTIDFIQYADKEIARLTAIVAAESGRKVLHDAEIASLQNVISEKCREIEKLKIGNEWTPITSVEQVEELEAGFYEVKSNSGKSVVTAWKGTFGAVDVIGQFGSAKYKTEGLVEMFSSFRLIRAFEAAPSIPSGAIEKKYAFYTCERTAKEWAASPNKIMSCLAQDLVVANEKIAALEALAKGEQ